MLDAMYELPSQKNKKGTHNYSINILKQSLINLFTKLKVA